jgi:hypothetical protein
MITPAVGSTASVGAVLAAEAALKSGLLSVLIVVLSSATNPLKANSEAIKKITFLIYVSS